MLIIFEILIRLVDIICMILHIISYIKYITVRSIKWKKVAGITCLAVVITEFIIAFLYATYGKNWIINAIISIIWFIDYVTTYRNEE